MPSSNGVISFSMVHRQKRAHIEFTFEGHIASFFFLQRIRCSPEHHGLATSLPLMSYKLLICCPKEPFLRTSSWDLLQDCGRLFSQATLTCPYYFATSIAHYFTVEEEFKVKRIFWSKWWLWNSWWWLGKEPNRPNEQRLPTDLRLNEPDAHIG